jgi:CheY-like chemotaxis protein
MTATAASTSPRQSILIAEDDPQTAALLMRVLRDELEVTHAADGMAAVLHLRRHPLPDLVLLDVVKGIQVRRLLQQ